MVPWNNSPAIIITVLSRSKLLLRDNTDKVTISESLISASIGTSTGILMTVESPEARLKG